MSPRPLVVLLCAVAMACSTDDGPVRPRGIPPPPVAPHGGSPRAPRQEPPEAPSKPVGNPDDFFATPLGEPPPPPPTPTAPTAPKPHEADPSDDEPPRDLGQEMVALLRPDACLDLAAGGYADGTTVQVHAGAVALPSGRLQEVSVQVSGQPAAALRCLAAQIEGRHLPTPIDDAPTQVTGTLSLEIHVAPARTPDATE